MIKVGIIGTGIIAREHAQAIASLPGEARLVAAADAAPERLALFQQEFCVSKGYSSASELITDSEVELVAVATPPAAHEESVVSALEAGKYVLCEKPLAHTLASAERIAKVAAHHPGRLAVSYQLRYAPYIKRMLWLIENGWIGEVQSAVVERHGYIPHSVYGKGGWWGAWSVAGGGVFMTQMIHELDIMLLAMGEPESVRATMDTRFTSIESEDWIEATARFAGNRVARLAASVNSGQMRGSLTIIGSHGSISPAGLELADPVRLAKAAAAADAALPLTRALSTSLPSRAFRKLSRVGRHGKMALTPHALLYQDIATSIAARQPLPISGAEALRSLSLVTGAYESAITGRDVRLPLGPDARILNGVTRDVYASRPKPEIKRPAITPLRKSRIVRVGLIGLDTTHATTFTELLHNPYASDHVAGGRVSAAFAGGSPDMHISASRVDSFTAELGDKYGVPILDSPEAVADSSDVVFILSADGRTHPGLFRSVAGRKKPVFVDKPFAISLADARMIFGLARETDTKVFASSAFRYADGLVAAIREIRASGETVRACQVRYWGQIQPTQGRYFWYGIHGAEMLVAVMGTGAKAVKAYTEGNRDLIDIEYADGRHSVLIGAHDDGTFHVQIETDRRTVDVNIGGAISARILASALDILTPGGYPRVWRASPIGSVDGRASRLIDPDEDETLEVVGMLEAAQLSHAAGGEWTKVESAR